MSFLEIMALHRQWNLCKTEQYHLVLINKHNINILDPPRENLGGLFYIEKSLGIMTRAVTLANLADQNIFAPLDGDNDRVRVSAVQYLQLN